MPGKDFKLFRIFEELFEFVIDSPVYSPPGQESRLAGVFTTGESIMNANNSTNMRRNSKSFLGMPTGTRRSCVMKKKPEAKNLVVLSLSAQSQLVLRIGKASAGTITKEFQKSLETI
jgi:hypothetical protein